MRRNGVIGIAALTLVLGASALVWWRARGSERSEARADELAVESSAAPRSSQTRHVLSLSRTKGADRTRKLVDVYVRWAGDATAVEARKVALNALFLEPALGLKLQGVLQAVAGDPTPPESDPLWPFLVDKLAELWTAETFDKGRDLMLIESRSRARRALVASFARLAERDRIALLGTEQRHALAGDFIDVYRQLDAAQTPEVLAALRALSGDDVADIMSGRALDPNFKLQAEIAHERAIEEAQALNQRKR